MSSGLPRHRPTGFRPQPFPCQTVAFPLCTRAETFARAGVLRPKIARLIARAKNLAIVASLIMPMPRWPRSRPRLLARRSRVLPSCLSTSSRMRSPGCEDSADPTAADRSGHQGSLTPSPRPADNHPFEQPPLCNDARCCSRCPSLAAAWQNANPEPPAWTLPRKSVCWPTLRPSARS